jgi:GTP:adenosylcobinamide-phosphate guanylyltransferase
MNVIITAGGCPQPGDPLYPLTRGGLKALLDVADRPMVQWVLDAMNGASSIERIILVGMPDCTGLTTSKPLTCLADEGDMLANIQAGAREITRVDPGAVHALVCSSDIPAVRPEMVDWLAEQVLLEDADICYNIIFRQAMEARYPGSRRTYLHIREGEVCGGDMNAIRLGVALGANPIWKRIIDSRKHPLRQAALVGFDTLFLLLIRRLSLQVAEKNFAQHLGLRGRALHCPYPEMGMDVDKPFQLEIMREELGRSQ